LGIFLPNLLPDGRIGIILAIGLSFHIEERSSSSPLGRRGFLEKPLWVVGDPGKVGLAGGGNGVPGKGTKQQEVMTMVRRRFSIAGLLAVGVMMIAADASQAQLFQRLRDRLGRGSSDEGSSRRFTLRRSYYRGEQTVMANGAPISA